MKLRRRSQPASSLFTKASWNRPCTASFKQRF